jgi:hypothetical protein
MMTTFAGSAPLEPSGIGRPVVMRAQKVERHQRFAAAGVAIEDGELAERQPACPEPTERPGLELAERDHGIGGMVHEVARRNCLKGN